MRQEKTTYLCKVCSIQWLYLHPIRRIATIYIDISIMSVFIIFAERTQNLIYMIDSIVFDLGGVVIGRDYDRYGHEIAEFSFLQGDRPFPEYWKLYDSGRCSREEVVAAISAETTLTPAQADAKLDRLMELFNEFHDTAELIAQLSAKGYKLYVLSNMPADFYAYVSRFDVFRYFDGQIISSAEKIMKPDPRFFGLLTERFGLKPENTLFVDDKPTNTEAARRLGFNVCLFTPGRESCDAIRAILGIKCDR